MDLPRETYAAQTEVMTSHLNVGSGEAIALMAAFFCKPRPSP